MLVRPLRVPHLDALSTQAEAVPDQRPAGSLHPEAPYRHGLVVVNPIAGRGKGRQVGAEVVEGLGRRGVRAEVFETSARGDARAHLRCMAPDIDLVVSVGGDGTLREVFSGMLEPAIPIGVLPLGTANVLSLDLGLPRDVDRALEVFLAKKCALIDTCTVNGHLSFLVTGVGLDGMAVRELEAKRKGPITRWSYLWAGLRALWSYRAPRLTVEVDGEPLPGSFGLVLVSNIIHYAGVIRLSRERKLDDGLFEVYLFRHGTRLGMLPYAIRGLLGLLPGGSCTLRRARRVRITSPEPVPCQVDGDYRGETPVEIEVGGPQYRLLVP